MRGHLVERRFGWDCHGLRQLLASIGARDYAANEYRNKKKDDSW